MDAVGLTVLLKELEDDCTVIRGAAQKAQLRLSESAEGRLEACAYELARLYNTLEKMLERICHSFENHFDKQGDYHKSGMVRRFRRTDQGRARVDVRRRLKH